MGNVIYFCGVRMVTGITFKGDYFVFLVTSSTPHRQLNLQTCLQAVAIRVTCHKTITVCSIYLPPSMIFNTSDFYDVLPQLPPPILITGDFNSHSTLWGCTKLDRRGKVVEDILIKHNFTVHVYYLWKKQSSYCQHQQTTARSVSSICLGSR